MHKNTCTCMSGSYKNKFWLEHLFACFFFFLPQGWRWPLQTYNNKNSTKKVPQSWVVLNCVCVSLFVAIKIWNLTNFYSSQCQWHVLPKVISLYKDMFWTSIGHKYFKHTHTHTHTHAHTHTHKYIHTHTHTTYSHTVICLVVCGDILCLKVYFKSP